MCGTIAHFWRVKVFNGEIWKIGLENKLESELFTAIHKREGSRNPNCEALGISWLILTREKKISEVKKIIIRENVEIPNRQLWSELDAIPFANFVG